MKKFYDSQHGRLVFTGREPTPDFWDGHWQTDNLRRFITTRKNTWITKTTGRFLPAGCRILEGGCGRGDKVYALQAQGFDAYGVDYARRTVEAINHYLPELRVSWGDVRDLPFEDGFFDGYSSLGVIEHFYNGYDDILAEMCRVLRPGGVLFVAFPAMSALRRWKATLGLYLPCGETADPRTDFYQFALDPNRVVRRIEASGMALVKQYRLGGVLGLKEETATLAPIMKWIDDCHSFWAKVLERILDPLMRPWANHAVLLVFSKPQALPHGGSSAIRQPE